MRAVILSLKVGNDAIALPQKKARDYAFLLLKFRPRSEQELTRRLKQKKFSPEIIKSTVSFLKEKGFLDDVSFAKAWIESRIRKPIGFRRLNAELKLKGVNQEIIDSQIQKIKENYSENETVLRIAREKFAKLKNAEPDKVKTRIYAYLLRRGFSPDAVMDAINQL